MTMRVRRVKDLYEAEVSPPHSDFAWVSPTPMREEELHQKLADIGCHERDIWDAFEEADKDFPGPPFSRRKVKD